MSENPYAPPAAEVADVSREAALERPQIVTIGIWLLWLQVLLSIPAPVISAFTAMADGHVGRRVLKLIFVLSIIAFTALLTWRAGQGRNWARIGHVVMLVLRIASMFATYMAIRTLMPDRVSSVFSFDDPLQTALFLSNHLLSIAAVTMLFTASASDWYRAMRSSR